ncbi:hypothetical protein PTSG_05673 [Salpingoeca rosetta]|uniref:Uncharacterized protein n=1 Tax=Salpingoeca rosetta (strain ATCC 50818 / BSB-021) TaxID=946362 RepID=F2UBW3_SALR5|nr:uncharacterized protein PTSG_05673 [Salpingoeca rosetta]EGD73979.1 hypothetical protein PTSG_05673 [Salpingoeca rosetta]|eukprot:XP_004993542.1 hypothetical protein PTSG_05673 [Salpingoeca rosetta]
MTEAERSLLPAYAQEIANMDARACDLGPFHTFELTSGGERVLSRTECFVDCNDTHRMGAFLRNGRLKAICEALRGGRQQELLKDKINYKLAGAGGYMAHQDGYWQILPDGVTEDDYKKTDQHKRAKFDGASLQRTRLMRDEEVCVCMIAVDSSDESNGAPSIAPKCNKRGWLGLNASDATLDAGLAPAEKVDADALDWKVRAMMCPRVRDRYYAYEAEHRRKNGSAQGGGRANRYFEGTPVLIK